MQTIEFEPRHLTRLEMACRSVERAEGLRARISHVRTLVFRRPTPGNPAVFVPADDDDVFICPECGKPVDPECECNQSYGDVA